MRCPECGIEVNEQISRCHSCGALIYKRTGESPDLVAQLRRRKRYRLPFLFLVAYLLLLFLITIPLFAVFSNRQKAERLHDNLGDILNALEEYADTSGAFPDDVDQLIQEGIIMAYPENPYHERLMKPRPVGKAFSGDFSYIPLYNEAGRAMACVLVGYGPDLNKGKDIFTAGNDYTRLMQFGPEPDGIPDGVVVVLHAERGSVSA